MSIGRINPTPQPHKREIWANIRPLAPSHSDSNLTTTPWADRHIDVEYPFQTLGPGHGLVPLFGRLVFVFQVGTALAYEKYRGHCTTLVLAQCWAHSWRYFEQAQELEPEASAIALAYIGKLYEHEAYIRDHNLAGQEKFEYRLKNSKPIVDAIFSWCFEQRQRIDLVKTNKLSVALNYVIKREYELKIFLSDPEMPIDTNHLERALRTIPIGRKNWLFCWSD
jgi:hypothetical protein